MEWYGKTGAVAVAKNHDIDRLAGAVVENPGAHRDDELDTTADESARRGACGEESKLESSETSMILSGCARQEAEISGKSEAETMFEQRFQGSRERMIADQAEKRDDETSAQMR